MRDSKIKEKSRAQTKKSKFMNENISAAHGSIPHHCPVILDMDADELETHHQCELLGKSE